MVSVKGDYGELEVKLPPLKVNIVRDGHVVRVVELPDPREAYCKTIGSIDKELIAVPG